MILLNGFSEWSAMAPRYTIATKKAPNPTDKHVGRRVRMRRKMLAMSQEKLGAALGLSFQQVQKYERGENRIGAGRLQQSTGIILRSCMSSTRATNSPPCESTVPGSGWFRSVQAISPISRC